MSLKQRIRQSVDRAFIALDDLAGPMTVKSLRGDPTYDPTNGAVTKSEQTFTVEAVFDMYATDRANGTVLQKEERLILVKPQDGLRPKVGDTIADAEAIVYEVLDVEYITAYDEVFLWELVVKA